MAASPAVFSAVKKKRPAGGNPSADLDGDRFPRQWQSIPSIPPWQQAGGHRKRLFPENIMAERDIKELVEKSAITDLQVLLTTKENAKRAVLEDPSAGNIAAFDRASKMLESAMGAQDSLKNWSAVLAYVREAGRKLGQTKFFEDVKRGRLKKQADGSFRRRDVDRYMMSLPMLETPDGVVARAAERQRKKEEAEIRKIRADAELRELELSVRRGKYILREDVYQELAARALALSSGIRTAFEAHALELVEAAGGDPRKVTALSQALERIFDDALSDYARELEIIVDMTDIQTEEPHGANAD